MHLPFGTKLRNPVAPNPCKRGFTLVELLVVIAIISVLSVVGFAVFTGVTKMARDSKRKVDIDAIAKAYEVQKDASYVPLQTSSFASGIPPTDPTKGDYFNWLDNNGAGFKVCASLENNPSSVCNTPATNCYCKFSTQGTLPSNSSANTTTSTNYTIGLGGSSQSSCDPNGTLLSGLVGYWEMDEGSGTNVNDSSGKGNNGVFGEGTRTPAWDTQTPFGNVVKFDASVPSSADIINFPNSADFQVSTELTLSAWIYPATATGQSEWIIARAIGVSPYDDYNLARYGTNIRFQIRLADGLKTVTATSVLNTTKWYHLVGTYNANTGNMYLYVDKVRYGPITGSGNIQVSSTKFKVGCWSTSIDGCDPTTPFNGKIHGVRIYNRALTDTEVNTLNNNGNDCI